MIDAPMIGPTFCGCCGELVNELHEFPKSKWPDTFFCLPCCQNEEARWDEDNGQFGVGA